MLGKLPSQPDFVREGAQGELADVLDHWLVCALPHLHAAGGVERMPALSFCLCDAQREHALLGVCAPSRDAAAREFPAAIFRTLELAALTPLSAAGERGRAFLRAAAALLDTLPDLSREALREALTELPEVETSGSEDALESFDCASFFASVSRIEPTFESFYGLYAFVNGLAPSLGAGPALICPVGGEQDVRAWLEIARCVCARTRRTPSYLHAPERGRLLVCSSSLSPELLRALADPRFTSDRVWPLTTESPSAREHARAELLEAVPELAAPSNLRLNALAERLAKFVARFAH
jgi:type VI secretion system ImpM family protein